MTAKIPKVPAIELNDGRLIPQLGFGTWRLRGEAAYTSVLKALELGYRHIDTASIYKNETEVGRAIKDSGVARADIWVTTKVWNDRQLDAEASLAESLERLGLDYVDLTLIHWPVAGKEDYLVAWDALIAAREAGKSRSIGVSNFMFPHLDRLDTESKVVPAVNQIEVHPTLGQREVVARNKELGIITEAWAPLGKGISFDSPAVTKAVEATGKTPAQVVLRWHIQQGFVIFPKSEHEERMLENAQIFDFELTEQQMTEISELNIEERTGPNPYTFTGEPETR